ncbi:MULTISPECIES: hypothetical protein [unclassified Dyella]|jgi:hypothetical protein|uniref:hypothetical protein n=1 Tax=unclassified Dyella TaxID=2634549 RepID=UPI003F921C4E
MRRVVLVGALLLATLGLGLSGPASADDASVGCPIRPLTIDIAHLKATAGVQSVVLDPTATRATVMYDNGDVLRVASTGCVTSMLSARLWVAGDDAMSDALWLERARSVTELVLAPAAFAQVSASLKADAPVSHVDGGMKIDRALADGAGYSLTVVRTPRDGLGASMSLVFRRL